MNIEYMLSKEAGKKGTGVLCNSNQTLNNFFMSNEKIKIKDEKITVDSYTASYHIESGEVEASKEKYFIIKIVSEKDKDEEDIKCLEVISKELRRAVKVKGFGFKISVLWDDVSNYYRKLSYPLISNVENLMRKLITQFMIKKIGTDWVKKALPDEFKSHIEQKNNIKDTNVIENLLYEADFIKLSSFLFNPYSELKDTKELFEKIKAIYSKSNVDSQINDILKLEPKSNWERFFTQIDILKNVSSEGLEKDWEKLYKIRNKVAHNKLFNKEDYNTLITTIEKVEKKIKNAIDNIDKVDVPEEQKETVAKTALNNTSVSSIIASKLDRGIGNSTMSAFDRIVSSDSLLDRVFDSELDRIARPSELDKILEFYKLNIDK